eukprot:8782580-Lingulodinium_polyedra.AAC.1
MHPGRPPRCQRARHGTRSASGPRQSDPACTWGRQRQSRRRPGQSARTASTDSQGGPAASA